MRASEFQNKLKIIYKTSKIFSNSMTKQKMKSLVDVVFDTEGEWIDNFYYVISIKVKGDLTGYMQGTDTEIDTKVGFLLDDRKYILNKLI